METLNQLNPIEYLKINIFGEKKSIDLRPLDAIFVGHFIVLIYEGCAAVRIVHLMYLMRRTESTNIYVCRCRHRSVRFVIVIWAAVVSARYVEHSWRGSGQGMFKISAPNSRTFGFWIQAVIKTKQYLFHVESTHRTQKLHRPMTYLVCMNPVCEFCDGTWLMESAGAVLSFGDSGLELVRRLESKQTRKKKKHVSHLLFTNDMTWYTFSAALVIWLHRSNEIRYIPY